jgi:hypothetical protein
MLPGPVCGGREERKKALSRLSDNIIFAGFIFAPAALYHLEPFHHIVFPRPK